MLKHNYGDHSSKTRRAGGVYSREIFEGILKSEKTCSFCFTKASSRIPLQDGSNIYLCDHCFGVMHRFAQGAELAAVDKAEDAK